MEYLTKADIIFINQKTIVKHGGNFIPPYNFLHEENLDYLIEAVQSELFGRAAYPEIHHKAGLYMFNIISNHIFQDGNKRTGLESALLFLKMNGYRLKDELEFFNPVKGVENSILEDIRGAFTEASLIKFVLDVAKGEVSLDLCQEWVLLNLEKF